MYTHSIISVLEKFLKSDISTQDSLRWDSENSFIEWNSQNSSFRTLGLIFFLFFFFREEHKF